MALNNCALKSMYGNMNQLLTYCKANKELWIQPAMNAKDRIQPDFVYWPAWLHIP